MMQCLNEFKSFDLIWYDIILYLTFAQYHGIWYLLGWCNTIWNNITFDFIILCNIFLNCFIFWILVWNMRLNHWNDCMSND